MMGYQSQLTNGDFCVCMCTVYLCVCVYVCVVQPVYLCVSEYSALVCSLIHCSAGIVDGLIVCGFSKQFVHST